MKVRQWNTKDQNYGLEKRAHPEKNEYAKKGVVGMSEYRARVTKFATMRKPYTDIKVRW